MEFHLVAASDIATESLEEHCKLVDVIDRTQGAPFCAGICEILPGGPVEFEYDDDAAACYMLEGEITLTEGGESRPFKPGDLVYIPQKAGLRVFWSTETVGRFFYVTYPHWR